MKYILAVSGGPDSMAMLSMYKRKAQAVCVVNYQKREHSDLDVKVVTDFCDLYNIKYYIHNVTQNFYNEHENENFQALAREIRYNFFLEVAKKEKNYRLLVAHNLNDHLETASMQFSRNSKALYYGLSRKGYYHGVQIIRPVLRFKKSTLERYCKQHEINYVNDYTNIMDIYERNRVRKVIQAWDSQRTLDFMKRIKDYNKQHKKLYKKVQNSFRKWSGLEFKLDFLLSLDANVQYYLIYEFLKWHDEKNNSENKIMAILEFLRKPKNRNSYRLENKRFLFVENNSLKIKL